MRRAVVCQYTCNGITVRSNTVWKDSGNSSGGAFEVLGNTTHSSYGNIFAFNLVEEINYKYAFNVSYGLVNSFISNTLYDCSGTTTTDYNFANSSLSNHIEAFNVCGGSVPPWTADSTSTGTTFIGIYQDTLPWLTHTCTIVVGADNASSVLANSDLGPQGRQCFVPLGGTVTQVTVAADTGTPSVIPAVNHAGSDNNLVSGALSTAASGGLACAKTSAVAGYDGVTTCSNTLQNTTIAAGDWLELVSGTAGSSAHRMSISITWTGP
jgi:hypothetical protein